MSKRAQRTSKYMFGTLAQLCENFIFIYLGLSLFTQTDLVYKPVFILVTTVCLDPYYWQTLSVMLMSRRPIDCSVCSQMDGSLPYLQAN